MKTVKSFVKEHGTTIAAVVVAAAVPVAAYAGTGGSTEFGDVWTDISGWTQGILGRIIAGSMILVGMVMGIARQSIMAFAVGIGGGIGLNQAPTLLDNVLGATLPVLN